MSLFSDLSKTIYPKGNQTMEKILYTITEECESRLNTYPLSLY